MSIDRCEVLVLGSGIAGLSVALSLPDRDVVVMSRGSLGEDGSSHLAQGGMAAALGRQDSAARHAQDTLRASQGGCRRGAVRILTEGAAEAIHWLGELGVEFDCSDGHYLLGREAAHSVPRIVHAGGDATGATIMRTLRRQLARQPQIRTLAQADAISLTRSDGRVTGLWYRDRHGSPSHLAASHVVLACGGVGGLFERTTNPREVNGTGIALALGVGARLADLEFVQFHPTALKPPGGAGDSLPLVTEALRGAGAVLVDERGQRFMRSVHPDAELAPRNVVACAIDERLRAGRSVYLDARAALGDELPRAFPTVYRHCLAAGIDPLAEPIPVTPAAHYHMGGISSDGEGRSSVPGLWVCGESARTGVHGANRLASNSLVEGVVFARRLATALRAQPTAGTAPQAPVQDPSWSAARQPELEDAIRRVLWTDCGLLRDGPGLERARRRLEHLGRDCGASLSRNALASATALVQAAAARRESRGAHQRRDARRRVA